MAKTKSPTARTLERLRELGWRAQVVERWNQYARRRVDLFGFIDIVAISPAAIVGIQACSGTDHARRKAKILEECAEAALDWCLAGCKIQIWSWSKRKPRGVKRATWVVRIEEVQA